MRRFALVTISAVVLAACGGSADGTKEYKVPSEAMLPTLDFGDTVNVDLNAYDSESPRIGDIVIFHPPRGAVKGPECGAPHSRTEVCAKPSSVDTDTTFIKRIAAGPGDRLRIEDGHPVVNGRVASEDFTGPCKFRGQPCNYPQEVTIPPHDFFMLGDNRAHSDDSRFWGPVPESAIVGKVVNP